MSLFSWFESARRPSSRRHQEGPRKAAERRRQARKLLLEGLEDRTLMAFNFLSEYAVGSSPNDVALAAIDSTGGLDLVTGNPGSTNVSVLSGNGNATFDTPATNSSTGTSPASIATGDFTGDNIPDLVTAGTGGVSLLVGNGDGSFDPPVPIALPGQFPPGYGEATPLAQQPLSVAAGDIDGDGKLDLAVGADTYFKVFAGCWYGCYYNYYYDGYANVLIGNGSGGFSAEAHHLGSYRFPGAIAIGDVNGDADADVITANSGDLSVLLGDGSGSVASPVHSGSGSALRSISLGDVDGDGNVDTVMKDWNGYSLRVQKGNGDGTFTAQPGVNTGSYIHSAVMGDVNADGKLDLAAMSSAFTCTSYGWYYCYDGYTTRQVNVLLGYGQGNFALPQSFNLDTTGYYSWMTDVVLSDLTGDNKPELAAVDYYDNSAIVAGNDGNWVLLPSIFISDATVVEGDSGTLNAEFTVSLLGEHAGGISVDFATDTWGATAGADYTTTTGSLTFGVGESSKTVLVPVIGDTIDEYDQQFVVNLSNAVAAQIGDSQGIGTIGDNDAAPLVTIDDVSKNEGPFKKTTSFVFTVSLSAPSEKWVYVTYSTSDGTAATADSDYYSAYNTVSIAPGQTSGNATVIVRGDKKKEADETFNVDLIGATNATISDAQGIGTIVNDDGPKGRSGTTRTRR